MDTNDLESQRSRSAKLASVSLAALGGVAFFGAILTLVEPVTGVISVGVIFAIHTLVAGTAMMAAGQEWVRERMGEVWAVAAGMGSFLLVVLAVTNGWWFYAPLIGTTNLAMWLTLLNRYALRDETRHIPPRSVW